MKATESMTPIEALSALHRLYETYLKELSYSAYVEKKALFEESDNAMSVLALGILGKPVAPRQRPYLCDFCHKAYHECYVCIRGDTSSFSCCSPCKDRLLSEGKLTIVDGTRVFQRNGGRE